MAQTMEQPKEKMVKIKIPRDRKRGDVFVSINERTWQIQRGVEVLVPECVAALLEDNARMEDAAEAYYNKVKN